MGLCDLKFPLNIQRFAASGSISCSQVGISIPNNTTTERITFTVARTSGVTHWDDPKTVTFTVNGGTYKSSLALPSSKTSASCYVDVVVPHNSDGTKSISFSASIATGTGAGTVSASGSKTLTTIPRYANITSFSVTNVSGIDGLTQLKVSYSVNSTIDYTWYSINGGSSWSALPSNGIISGLSPGTQYNVKIRVRRKDSQLTTDSNSAYPTTLQINKITSGTPNISNGQELNVTASNISGADCQIVLECPIGTTRYIVDGTEATFTIEQINALLEDIQGQTEPIRVIANTINDDSIPYQDYVDGVYTVVASEPIFNHFDYEDINEKTLALTGNNQTCIIGYSNIKAIVPVLHKAIAQNHATMEKYRLVIGNVSNEANYSDTEDVSITINKALNGAFSMYAIDSRGFATIVNKVVFNAISYIDIQKNNDIIASRVNDSGEVVGASEKVKVTFSGKIWKGNFGQKENGIKSLSYRYKTSFDNTWSEWLSLNTSLVTIDEEGKFTFNSLIKGDTDLGFDENNPYNIELIIEDELSQTSYSTNIGSAIPHQAWHKNGVSFMGKYDEEKGGKVQIAGTPVLEYEIIDEW